MAVGTGVGVGTAVAVGAGVTVGTGVGDGVGSGVAVGAGNAVGRDVAVGSGVAVGTSVAVGTWIGVGDGLDATWTVAEVATVLPGVGMGGSSAQPERATSTAAMAAWLRSQNHRRPLDTTGRRL